MKSFKENLVKFEELDLYLYKVLTATEVETAQLSHRDDENFEEVCEYVYDWIIHSEMDAARLCEILKDGIDSGEITLQQIIDNDDAVEDYVETIM